MYNIFLYTHIVGAGVLAIFICTAVFEKVIPHQKLAFIIAYLTMIQLMSGSILSIITNTSLLSFCSRIGIYMFVVSMVEMYLFYKTQKNKLEKFPTAYVLSSISAGMLIVFATLSSFIL